MSFGLSVLEARWLSGGRPSLLLLSSEWEGVRLLMDRSLNAFSSSSPPPDEAQNFM